MRSVVLAVGVLGVLGLSGCATVSVVSGEALVEADLSQEQTALRTAASGFCDMAEKEGWVEASNGFANLASILMHGQKQSAARADSYGEHISAETAPAADVVSRIAADADAAREGLVAVRQEARTMLASETSKAGRADVTSFERALVHAQRASRAFTDALQTVAARTSETQAAETAIGELDAAIDEARRAADALAARYASIGERVT